ncbi:MAG: hypothetical protein V9G19_08845 [Tetrasphaera sp.]
MNQALEQVEQHTSTTSACALLGLSRASVYRARGARVHGPGRKPGGGSQPAALSPEEIQEVIDVLTSDRFADTGFGASEAAGTTKVIDVLTSDRFADPFWPGDPRVVAYARLRPQPPQDHPFTGPGPNLPTRQRVNVEHAQRSEHERR